MAEVTSVDKSIVMILKPIELAKKKEKFKQVCTVLFCAVLYCVVPHAFGTIFYFHFHSFVVVH